MANSETAIEMTQLSPGERGSVRRRIAALIPALPRFRGIRARPAFAPVDNQADSGEPLENLPPFVETIGFDEPAEPLSAPVPARAAAGASAMPERLRAVAQRLRAAPPSSSGDAETRGSRNLAFAAKCAGALAVVAAIAYLGGLGTLGRSLPVKRSSELVALAPSDPVQRVAYFQRAAEGGSADAELQLAIFYAKGEGVAQDYAIAAKWFRAAAEQGVARAQYDLGVLYERGRGVEMDQTEAANWYLRAAKANYPLAQYNLAVAYTKGQGTRQDFAEAALWYRRAAGHGVVQAMINLGMLYERGDGLPASPVDAYAWYQAAGRRGNQAAERRAAELYAALPRMDQIRAEALAGDVAGSIHDPAPTEKPAAAGS
jgi:TPR repeat protein